MDDTDTDTLIALVSSILPQNDPSPDQNEIIDALILANGDVKAAAQFLNRTSRTSDPSSTGKRKRVDLDDWLNLRSQKFKPKVLTANKEKSLSPSRPIGQRNAELKSTASTSTSKPATNFMNILRQPPSLRKDKLMSHLPPLMLSSPEMVARHTPCTMHLSVLPPELACQLFYTMVDASKKWKKNKWWLFDRVVESPHLTSFFARKTDGLSGDESWQEAAQYWYNGRKTGPPEVFPPEMEEACKIVEEIVNKEIKRRTQRYKFEWGGRSENESLWRANVAASNCYQGGKESVGFHSDQLTYLGPYPTIASLSLGTRRNFSLREVIPTEQIGVRKAQTFNIPLTHNSLTIMHSACQEKFKHSIPPQTAIDLFRPGFPQRHGDSTTIEPSNCRINITFRFYRPDFRPPSIPRCRCGVPTILRPDMKNRTDDETDRYFWTCYAGAQNDGKGCKFWKLLDMEDEGRGPCIGTSSDLTPKLGAERRSEQRVNDDVITPNC